MGWYSVSDMMGTLNTIRSKGNDATGVKDSVTWHGHAKKEQDAGTARATTSDEIALQA
jgi:hypothetical protein